MKFCRFLSCLLFVLLSLSMVAFAAEEEPTIRFYPLDEEGTARYMEYFSLAEVQNYSGYTKQFIYCFDVSSEGECVVFFDDATVVIMDSNGEAQRVLRFKKDILETRTPSEVSIHWEDGNIRLLKGSDRACVFTPDGELIEVCRYETDLNTLPKQKEISVGEVTYSLEYSHRAIYYGGGMRYDRFVKTDAHGAVSVLFDSETAVPSVLIQWVAIELGILAFAIFIVVKTFQLKRERARAKASGQGEN